ncbi:hypothetical protein I5M32_08475 [Pedobacter sp. SD-b]|uniref:Copper chaperone CopZ n=1 Tax=Pedobacter segetis TaxID=2793069 RepID=A0ABS1BJB1_9SPHI|nr:hypothetical protein [Pedobacter segetis]MBK0382993.1 hypothetical protein [Pedobacter segetis]
MVEVFKTNVKDHVQANFLLYQLNKSFPAYEINFDLEDCDNILRIESYTKTIDASQIVDILNSHGFIAQILPDIVEYTQ